MSVRGFVCGLSISAAALLAACGGSQPPIGALGASMQSELDSAGQLSPDGRYADKAKYPVAPLTDVGGVLYGTTEYGGAFHSHKVCRGGCGTVFGITTSGGGKLLHSFGGAQDGQNPQGGLVSIGNTLYGTTSAGGAFGGGTVFSITTDGVEKVLHSFGAQGDGADPINGSLLVVRGKLYGTTWGGGTGDSGYSCSADGCGTVFSITTSGVEKVTHSFGNDDEDGQRPWAGLVHFGTGTTLYGTTMYGGSVQHPLGHANSGGTVFSITTSGIEKVLYSLGRGHSGIWPMARLLPVHGALYGTTSQGGAHDSGTVFVVTTDGKAKTLHSFSNLFWYDGDWPAGGLVDLKGTLYGTTRYGGACDQGTVFSVTTAGAETVLHGFCGGADDGSTLWASLIDVNGLLYGTTEYGGGFPKGCSNGRSLIKGCGTVFSITTGGNLNVIHRFH